MKAIISSIKCVKDIFKNNKEFEKALSSLPSIIGAKDIGKKSISKTPKPISLSDVNL